MKFALVWLYKMRWFLLIVAGIVLAYTIGAPKDMGILDWIKGVIQ